MKVVLTSFTPLGSPGGVPRWCRDFVAGFPEGSVVHHSWADVVRDVGQDHDLPEWEKARLLNRWLVQTKKLTAGDVLVGDGFWADAYGYHPVERTLQVSHGNWSHTTLSDVKRGIMPEFPEHHKAQLFFRRDFDMRSGRSVAVSDFIAHQCRIQWQLDYPVINNGVDLGKFRPADGRIPRKRPVIVHGVTTANKGYAHIRLLEKRLDADVLLLDDAARFFNSLQSERRLTKYQALAQADLVVTPSAHEGNSYFLLEALASDVPVVAYSVGLPFKLYRDVDPSFKHDNVKTGAGLVINRDGGDMSPENFLACVKTFIHELDPFERTYLLQPRKVAEEYSVEVFQRQWRDYLAREFGFAPVPR